MQHTFDIVHAAQYGLNEAILINNFEFWIVKNIGNKRHNYDGRTWTYNSVSAFEFVFPYLSHKQIRRSIDRLVSDGVLLRGNYNQNTYDRTSWFAFTDEFLSKNPLPCGAHHLPCGANGIVRKGKSLTNTDINTDTAEPSGFALFWQAYPKKVAKPSAIKAFKAVKLKDGEIDSILTDIETRKESDDWIKQDGKYIPLPATYLNNRRWEDGETAHTGPLKVNGVLAGAI